MDSKRVRGILPAQDLTPLEHPHPWICGQATFRRRPVPVVDLRAKLDLPHGVPGRQPCIVVIEGGVECRLFGFVADRVSEVVTFRERDFRGNMIHTAGRPRRVFDPDQILNEEELAGLAQVTATSTLIL